MPIPSQTQVHPPAVARALKATSESRKRMNTYSPEKRRELETDARAVVTRGGSATKPTIYVNLQGGAIHDIRATKGLEDVTIVFSGDDQDCDPENLVTLNPELPDFIYAVAKPNGNISAALAKFLHKQASLYNAKR